MRYLIFSFCLLLSQLSLSAQQETELIKLEYLTSGISKISDSPYGIMNQIGTANTSFTATLNYGHDLKAETSSMFYSMSYSHFSQELDVSDVMDNEALESIPTNFYQYPNFSQISFTSGANFKLNKKWAVTLLGALNYTDDFFKSELKSNFTWLSMAYIERKKSDNFSYGFGAFINQLENKFLFTPSISLKLHNEKVGLEILLPEKIRFWYKVKQNNYFEASLNAKSLSVEYADESYVRGLDIYTIKGDIGYNLIWQDFLKLKIGFDFPLVFNSIKSTSESFEFYQYNSIGFNIGLSLILPNE